MRMDHAVLLSVIFDGVGSAHAPQAIAGRLAPAQSCTCTQTRRLETEAGKPERFKVELSYSVGLLRINLINVNRTQIHPARQDRPVAILLPVYFQSFCQPDAEWILSRMIHTLGIMGETSFIPAGGLRRQAFWCKAHSKSRYIPPFLELIRCWCGRRDSNPHGRSRGILSPTVRGRNPPLPGFSRT